MKLVALAVVLLALAVAWFAGEKHYENCVEVAEKVAEARASGPPSGTNFNVPGDEGEPRPSYVERRIKGCSRVPW